MRRGPEVPGYLAVDVGGSSHCSASFHSWRSFEPDEAAYQAALET
jgi:hypothetical protein